MSQLYTLNRYVRFATPFEKLKTRISYGGKKDETKIRHL
jgi:hypothetical protein